jgi:hypothetical protein
VQRFKPRETPPPRVEAVQLTAANVNAVLAWSEGVEVTIDSKVAVEITTPIGARRVSEGEYLIRDDNGFFSVLSAEEFEIRFETA